ncbi:MAG: SH3 domain-containing protein [Clostridiaceae bacterium]|nr:SH3 domain-containing protein [Clostridiaceae bacterium]
MSDEIPVRGSEKDHLIRPGRVARRGRPNVRRRRQATRGVGGRLLFFGLPALAFVLIITVFIVAVASSKQVEVPLQEYSDLEEPGGLIDRDHPLPLEPDQEPEEPEETEPEPEPEPTILIVELDPTETTEPDGGESYPFVYVIKESAGIYEAPVGSSLLLATVQLNDKLFQTGEADEWTPVRWKKNIEGYIRSSNISDTPFFIPKTGETYYVQNRQVYVREGPGTHHLIAGFALRGMTVQVMEAGDDWSMVRTEHGLDGYMHNELFGPNKPADELTELETGCYKYVNTEVANLREEPSTDSEIIGAAFMDDRIFQISDNGGWSKVRTEGGVIAYVFNHLLRDTPPANPFIKTNRKLYAASSSVNVRSSPTTDASVLARLTMDQAVTELEANDTWSKVKLESGTTGFVRSELLTHIEPPPAGFTKTSGSVYVTTNAANIRSEPNTNCAIVVVVRYRDKLTVKAVGPSWTMIQTSAGKTGYISNDLISKDQPAPASSSGGSGDSGGSGSTSGGSSSSSNDSRQLVVDIARSALGVPYRYSGKTMSAFDCSGLVKYVFEAIGYKNIPHGADPQARQLGTRIAISGKDYSGLLPGDLLFFSRGSGYHHVGIYIGNDQMIHASSSHGGVIITDLQRYVAAARVNRVID